MSLLEMLVDELTKREKHGNGQNHSQKNVGLSIHPVKKWTCNLFASRCISHGKVGNCYGFLAELLLEADVSLTIYYFITALVDNPVIRKQVTIHKYKQRALPSEGTELIYIQNSMHVTS